MAVQEVRSGDHPREKAMKTNNKSDKKVYLVAQELKLARVLAGNNKTSRDRALKSLKKWFTHRSKTLPFTDNDFQIIWKGLYFSMWMSDKPLIQEECAENIASLIHFQTFDESLLFFKNGLTILMNEWFGIDQLRLDKFLMLVRRLLRHMLLALKKHGLSKKNIDKFGEVISFTILNTDIRPPVGLFMHFTEIYLEEIAKVTNGNMPSERLVDFIQPFVKKLVKTSDGREIAHIKKFIFNYLMKQSNIGIEYQIKYDAWKKEGFPGTINSMQKVKVDKTDIPLEDEDSENEHQEKPLDPRAGRVNVELPQLKFRAKDITNALLEYKFDKGSNLKSRKTITELINQFTKMSKGVYPLGVKRVLDSEKNVYDTSIRKATNRLIKFEKKLMGKDKKKRKQFEKKDEEKVEIPKKRRKIDNISNVKVKESVNENGVTEEELEKFIAQSEEGLVKKLNKKKKNVEKVQESKKIEKTKTTLKRKLKNEVSNSKTEVKKKIKNKEKPQDEIINNIECVFERNSGTWVVYDINRDKQQMKAPSQTTEYNKEEATVSFIKHEGPSTSSFYVYPSVYPVLIPVLVKPLSMVHTNLGTPNNGNETPSTNKVSPQESAPAESGSPKSGLSPVRLFESPPKPKELFPKSSWDEPLQEGEYEICIPSKKHVARLKRRAKKSNVSVHKLINTSMKQIRGKNRMSLDSNLIKNPFSTPVSAKKVKINTKLNKSQEIHEHVMQILSSPGIPYDANKKPSKPLLKSSASSTPVNPFYNKQLSIW